jgi:CMP-N-acetylneuraminic acid synthetase
MPRALSLDTDETLGIHIYQSFASLVDADIYVLVHATSPFLTQRSLQKGVESVLHGGHDSSFSVRKVSTFAWFSDSPLNYSLDCIPRTQDLSPIFWETSGFYIFRKHVISQGKRIGDNPCMIELSAIEATDIDTLEDLEDARLLWHAYQ